MQFEIANSGFDLLLTPLAHSFSLDVHKDALPPPQFLKVGFIRRMRKGCVLQIDFARADSFRRQEKLKKPHVESSPAQW